MCARGILLPAPCILCRTRGAGLGLRDTGCGNRSAACPVSGGIYFVALVCSSWSRGGLVRACLVCTVARTLSKSRACFWRDYLAPLACYRRCSTRSRGGTAASRVRLAYPFGRARLRPDSLMTGQAGSASQGERPKLRSGRGAYFRGTVLEREWLVACAIPLRTVWR